MPNNITDNNAAEPSPNTIPEAETQTTNHTPRRNLTQFFNRSRSTRLYNDPVAQQWREQAANTAIITVVDRNPVITGHGTNPRRP